MNRTLAPEDTQALYRPESRAKMSPMISYQGAPLHAIDSTETMLAYERVDRLVEYHCMRLDRMTMGCGLEARVPFLDHRLVEKVLAIPRSQLFGGGGKAVLQRIARGWVPEPIIHRKKVHFPSLPDQWLRGPGLRWAKDILLDPEARIANWLDVSALERYLREHAEGVRNRGRVLWAVVVLELWCRGLKGWRAAETDLQRTQSKW
jgi:asparagine synthase (glutamine-hydrolysing)